MDEQGEEHPTIKTAGTKSTLPGKKEVYRHPHGEEDVIQLAQEPQPEGYHHLLRPVMRNEQIIPGGLPPLSEIRELAQAQLSLLPGPYRALVAEQPYPVRLSEGLRALRAQAAHQAEKALV